MAVKHGLLCLPTSGIIDHPAEERYDNIADYTRRKVIFRQNIRDAVRCRLIDSGMPLEDVLRE